jgi:hypothetical protein
VLGTYRDTELARTHPLAATLVDLHRDADVERITLSGLNPEDVTAYLAAVGRDDRALGVELAKVTSGNPFFLIETLRHVEETGGTWDRRSRRREFARPPAAGCRACPNRRTTRCGWQRWPARRSRSS